MFGFFVVVFLSQFPFCEVLFHDLIDTQNTIVYSIFATEVTCANNTTKKPSQMQTVLRITPGMVQVQPRIKVLVHQNEEAQMNALRDWYSDAQKNEKIWELKYLLDKGWFPVLRMPEI